MDNREPITKKQKSVYDYVSNYIHSNTIAPTVREIATNQNLHVSNVKRYLDVLQESGWIVKMPMKNRGIKLLKKNNKPIHYLATAYSYGGECSIEHRHKNYRIAVRQAWELFSMGINVYSPIVHHHNIQAVEPMVELPTSQWMEYDLPYLAASEKIYVLCTDRYEESQGVQAEIQYAKDNHKEIEYLIPTPFVLYGEDLVEF